MLTLVEVSKRFGGVQAVQAVSLEVRQGDLLGLIGPNGSGKSTLVNLITGVFPPSAGRVVLRGQDITGWAPHRVLAAGVGRTFQNIRLFGNLTVWQNLWVAQNGAGHRERPAWRRWLGVDAVGARRIEETLAFCGLAERRHELARNLAFGEQRRLELARALAADPALLLLDEPAAGLTAAEIDELAARIRTLRGQGKTLLLIEHHMELVMAVAERVVVLNFGQKIAEGTPAAVQDDERVREAYLGARRR